MATIINGKATAERIIEEICAQSANLERRPCLAVILVGNDPASELYVRNKRKDCEKCGFESREFRPGSGVSQEELLCLIRSLNEDSSVDGILVQLPLPPHINEMSIIEAISPNKDVDSFHPENVGRMFIGEPKFLPCTPAGIMELFRTYGIELEGKKCVMVGRSNIVGKPMSLLMLRNNGTVTTCHSFTDNLAEITKEADVLVVATGNRNLISGDMVKEGAVVIDVAMNRDPCTGKFTGDVIFDEVEPKASFITPVPGGVGPMTRAMLMKNILTAALMHQGKENAEI